MNWPLLYYRAFNFLIRRVVAVSFVVLGLIIGLSHVPALIDPNGTILWNGEPSSDIVIRTFAVLMPLVLAVLGVLLFRARPWYPPALRSPDNGKGV